MTLFHALPGENVALIRRELDMVCRHQSPFALSVAGLRSLGRGVAVAFTSPELVQLRQALAREWRDWLTAQDSARIAPHVTIQNKVSPETARTLIRDLESTLRPIAARAEGLDLWHYLGGPWQLAHRFTFAGR